MKKALIAGCILSGLAASAAPSVALPPFTITGRVVNYGRQSVSEVSSGNAEIRAYKSDGTLVARSQIATEENLVENYRLVIPLSSSESPTSASVGEKLSFQVQQQDVVYSAPGMFEIDSSIVPGGVARMDVMAASDSDGNGVADEYEALMKDQVAYYRWAEPGRYGSLSDAYDKDADYDGDGVSNYGEYVAGTNPFDEKDTFRILHFGRAEGGKWEIRFFAHRDRAYTVERTTALKSAEAPFAQGPFSESAAAPSDKDVEHVPAADVGVRSVFVLPAPSIAPAQFFRVNVQ